MHADLRVLHGQGCAGARWHGTRVAVDVVSSNPDRLETSSQAGSAQGEQFVHSATSGRSSSGSAGPEAGASNIALPEPVLRMMTALAEADSRAEALHRAQRIREAIGGTRAPELEPMLRALTDRATHVEQLRALADTDPLTGVQNRRGFQQEVERELARRARAGGPLSLALLDLDELKRLNDEHGHACGDQAIQMVARCCMDAVRRADRVARLGGDEFAVLLPRVERAQAQQIADRLRRCIEEHAIGDHALRISIGVASLEPSREPGVDAGAFVARADVELYRDKTARRADAA